MVGVQNPLPGIIYPPADRLARYAEAGELPDTTVAEALQQSFRDHAARPALSSAGKVVTYGELDDITDRAAGALIDLGLQPLERVLFQSTNSIELLYAFIGCLKAGLIPVCTLAAHREREIGYLGRHVDAQAMIVQGDDAKFDLPAFALKMQGEIPTVKHVITMRGEPRTGTLRLEALIAEQDRAAARDKIAAVPRDPYQVGVFQLSGGTTGVPKVIPRMNNDYVLNAMLTARHMSYVPEDVMFMPMPMIHNASMICFWLPTLLSGAEFMVQSDMTPEGWAAAFRDRRPTFIGLIRPLFPRLDGALEIVPETLDRVRGFWCPDAARLLREKYGRPTYAMFGMSEGMNMYTADSDPDEAKDWTVGRPLSRFDEVRLVVPGTDEEVGLDEIGELTCRGPYTLSGYYNAPERNIEAFTPAGFYKTGDLVVKRRIGEHEYYAFAGRTKDVVDRGSEKINCEEVENAVSTHAAIAGCAVVGMPDPILGERVCAYVVLRRDSVAPSVQELGGHLEKFGMAKFKWPERIETIEALPLTKVGKLDKAVLRTDITQKLAADNKVAEPAASS